MDRFHCNNLLLLEPCLERRTLSLSIYHMHHSVYFDIQLSPAALEFVSQRVSAFTPAEIYHDLQASDLPRQEKQRITESQIYYQCQRENAKLWRHDDDQLKSAILLLDETSEKYGRTFYTVGNMHGLAIYILESISTLASCAKELAIDSTYGTNNTGMELFAVLAEVDGTGIPLAYLFAGTSKPGEKKDDGAMIHLLEQFLRRIKLGNFKPTFFGCDKDDSEIAAIQLVWPNSTIQLCLWHAKRAIRSKLKDSKKTNTQFRYFSAEAQKIVSNLEICWGSLLVRRPSGDHGYGRCECESRSVEFQENGRLEPSSVDEWNLVLEIFSRHYNAHPLITDQNGTYRSSEDIHRQCATEMYAWCRARNYFRLWAYVWINWCRPGRWELWARAANPHEIPVLKTTMIVEGLWRALKHEYLHRFNRPRIDLVLFICLRPESSQMRWTE